MFNQDQSGPPNFSAPAVSTSPAEPDEVYVMPEKFQPQRAGSSNKSLFIAAGVLLLVIVATATYFLFDMWQKNQEQELAALSVNSNENVNTDQNENSNVNADANLNNSLTNSLATTTETDLSGEASTTTPSVGPNFDASLDTPVFSSDIDSDGLTDLEENIFGSSITKPDTDGDGFTDGQEVINGFNPVRPGSSAADKLAAATIIGYYQTNFSKDNFAFSFVKDWAATSLETIGEARVTAPTGEVIKIYIRDNDQGLSAANWYLTTHPQATLSALRPLDVNGLKGVFSPSGLQAYLTNAKRDKFYIFEYGLEAGKEFRYPAIFTFMIKSFKLVAGGSTQPAPATAQTVTSTP